MTTAVIYARAVELDDNQPDDVCPGCGQDITGWRDYEAHYPRGVELGYEGRRKRRLAGDVLPMPFTTLDTRGPERCPWDRDYLTARVIRRRLISEGVSR